MIGLLFNERKMTFYKVNKKSKLHRIVKEMNYRLINKLVLIQRKFFYRKWLHQKPFDKFIKIKRLIRKTYYSISIYSLMKKVHQNLFKTKCLKPILLNIKKE